MLKNKNLKIHKLQKNIDRLILKKSENPYLESVIQSYKNQIDNLNANHKQKEASFNKLLDYIQENLKIKDLNETKRRNLKKQLSKLNKLFD